jgi:hypothetical protein
MSGRNERQHFSGPGEAVPLLARMASLALLDALAGNRLPQISLLQSSPVLAMEGQELV